MLQIVYSQKIGQESAITEGNDHLGWRSKNVFSWTK